MQCSSARCMAKPESSKRAEPFERGGGRTSQAVATTLAGPSRSRGERPSRTTFFAHLTGPSVRARGRRHRGPRVRFRVVQAVRARGRRARIHRSNARLPRASHPPLDLPKGTGNENADAGCPTSAFMFLEIMFLENLVRINATGRADQDVRLCDPAPAPHLLSHARQPRATRCARRAE